MAYALTLVGASTFISASGKIYHKGPAYSPDAAEEATLIAAKDDYEVPYFAKVAGSVPVEVAESVPESPVPTIEDVAKSINDPTPSASTAEQGETDTATEPTRRVGRPAKVAI